MGRVVLLCNRPRELARELVTAAEVVTPNRYAAAALGVPYLGLDSLARECLPSGLSTARGLARRRVLRDNVATLWPGEPAQRVCQWVEPALRRWLRAGLHTRDLGPGLPPRASEVDALARGYVALLRRRGEVDSACAAWLAAGDRARRRLVTGFPRLERDALHLLDAACADGSTVILPFAELPLFADNLACARWLEARGWRIDRRRDEPQSLGDRLAARWLGADVALDGCGRQTWPDAESEVRGVLAEAKRLILRAGVRADEIALVTRDERAYGPLVSAVAAEMDLRVHIAYAIPLRETRLGWWLAQGLAALGEDLPYELTLRWLGTRWHELADAWDPAEALRQRPNGPDDWARAGAPPALLGVPSGRAPAAAWLDWLTALLDTAASIQHEHAREALALRRLRAAIDEARREAPGTPWSLLDFAEEVGDWLDTLTVPAQPGRGGLELHTPLALLGAQRRHLFVLGTTEGALPQPVSDDAFLDFRDREAVNALVGGDPPALETAEQAARREALMFWSLLGAPTETLRFTLPETAGNSATSPSAWLAPLALPALPREPWQADWPSWRQTVLRGDQREPVVDEARRAHCVEWRREGIDSPDAHDGALGHAFAPPKHYSVSQLTALASCPFRWFGQRALGLSGPDETAADPDPAARGSALHRALELTLRAALAAGFLRDRTALAKLAEHALDAAVGADPPDTALGQAVARAKEAHPARRSQDADRNDDEARAEWLGRLPNWPRLRAEWLGLLQRAVRQPDFMPEDATPVAFEVGFGGDWQGLPVIGFIDRIDRLDDGSLALLDYKTAARVAPGVPEREDWPRFDLQVPLYQSVYAQHSGETVSQALYLCRLGEAQTAKVLDDTVYIAFADWVRRVFDEGSFAPDPDAAGNACRYCDLDAVCRRGPRLDRKRG